jgi:hypothetical protein
MRNFILKTNLFLSLGFLEVAFLTPSGKAGVQESSVASDGTDKLTATGRQWRNECAQ